MFVVPPLGGSPSDFRLKSGTTNLICNCKSTFISLFLTAILFSVLFLSSLAVARADIELPEPNRADPITVSARSGEPLDLGRLRCLAAAGKLRPAARKPSSAKPRGGDLDRSGERKGKNGKQSHRLSGRRRGPRRARASPVRPELADQTWLGRFFTTGEIQVFAQQVAGEPAVMPPIYQRGMDRRRPISSDTLTRSEVLPAQFVAARRTVGAGRPAAGTDRRRECLRRDMSNAIRIAAGHGRRPPRFTARDAGPQNSRFSPRRSGFPSRVDARSQRSEQPPSGGDQFRREYHRRLHQLRNRRASGKSIRSTSRPTARLFGRSCPNRAEPRGERRRHARPKRAAGIVHGRQHRFPAGRSRDLRRPDVLRRAQQRRHHSERRNAHAASQTTKA